MVTVGVGRKGRDAPAGSGVEWMGRELLMGVGDCRQREGCRRRLDLLVQGAVKARTAGRRGGGIALAGIVIDCRRLQWVRQALACGSTAGGGRVRLLVVGIGRSGRRGAIWSWEADGGWIAAAGGCWIGEDDGAPYWCSVLQRRTVHGVPAD
ncbi:hypothetical protein ACLOJK_039805, partial [Asimina triloba]